MNSEIRAIASSLTFHDLRCLAAAEGYVELEMYDEAREELQKTSALCQRLPLTKTLELCVCAGLSEPLPILARSEQLLDR